MPFRITIRFFVALLILPLHVSAQELSHMSIDELINLDITSVSKKKEKASGATAALFVLTQDDIRRSGATSLPEVLRLVPGVHVSRIDANTWAITIRGFNNQFANKLLVLIDGRTSYTPLFSGVFWDVQDTILADIERIEVIRGPGATMWGANAVNGVINIITKNAKDTLGLHASAGGGSHETAFAETRYGGLLGEHTAYRAFVKYFLRDDFDLENSNESAQDSWTSLRTGFRSDTELENGDTFSFIADAYRNEKDQSFSFGPLTDPVFPDEDRVDEEQKGISGLGRWTRKFSAFSELQLQAYYEFANRDDTPAELDRNTYDLDAQFRFPLFDNHDIIVGAGWRLTEDSIESTPLLAYSPDNRSQRIYSAFIQDEIEVVEDKLKVSIGAKFEEHTFTGLEIQPNIRSSYAIDSSSTFWAAISRAVRTPSRTDESANFLSFEDTVNGLPVLFSGRGSGSLDAENLTAYEAGYRHQIADNISIDLSAFYFKYDDIVSAEANQPILIPGLFYPQRFNVVFDVDNNLSGEMHGVEAVIDYRPVESWRLVGNYSFHSLNLYGTGTTDSRNVSGGIPVFVELEKANPQHQAGIRSMLNISSDIEFDAHLRFTDNFLPINAQYDLDLRLSWKATEDFEISLVGQNLIEGEHLERVQPQYGQPTVDIPRRAYLKAVLQF